MQYSLYSIAPYAIQLLMWIDDEMLSVSSHHRQDLQLFVIVTSLLQWERGKNVCSCLLEWDETKQQQQQQHWSDCRTVGERVPPNYRGLAIDRCYWPECDMTIVVKPFLRLDGWENRIPDSTFSVWIGCHGECVLAVFPRASFGATLY